MAAEMFNFDAYRIKRYIITAERNINKLAIIQLILKYYRRNINKILVTMCSVGRTIRVMRRIFESPVL